MPMTKRTWITASADGALLGVGSSDGQFVVLDLRGGTTTSFDAGAFVTRARWASDDRHLFVGTSQGALHVLTRTGDSLVRTLDTGHGQVRGLAVHPDGTQLATCGDDGRAVTRSTTTFEPLVDIPAPSGAGAALSVAFVRDGVLLVGYASGFFEAWERTGKKSIAGGEVLSRGVASIAATSKGNAAVLGGAAGSMMTLLIGDEGSFTAGTVRKGTPPKPIAVNAIDIAPDGRFVAAFSDDTAEVFKDVHDSYGSALGSAFYSRSPKPEWTQNFIVSGACFVGRTGVIATSHFDGCVRFWAAVDGLSFEREVATLRFDAGRALVTSGNTVRDSPDALADWWVGLVASVTKKA